MIHLYIRVHANIEVKISVHEPSHFGAVLVPVLSFHFDAGSVSGSRVSILMQVPFLVPEFSF